MKENVSEQRSGLCLTFYMNSFMYFYYIPHNDTHTQVFPSVESAGGVSNGFPWIPSMLSSDFMEVQEKERWRQPGAGGITENVMFHLGLEDEFTKEIRRVGEGRKEHSKWRMLQKNASFRSHTLLEEEVGGPQISSQKNLSIHV